MTWLVLRWACRKELKGALDSPAQPAPLSTAGRLAAFSILITGIVLLTASALGQDLGAPTCIAALVAVLAVTRLKPAPLLALATGVSWSVIPLVAGLFVLVEALNAAGAQQLLANLLSGIHDPLAASFGIAALANVMNNIPSGLLAAGALQAGHIPTLIRNAVLIGTDLGPNLSVTGSLATILWLIALRREGVRIDAWQFLKIGLIVMPPALFLATLSLLI
jgi:arsenical pump membrane protein